MASTTFAPEAPVGPETPSEPSNSKPQHPPSFRPPLNSHDTALAILPPPHLWPPINALRSLYDKAHTKWPPHINLVYPFVSPEDLEEAMEVVPFGIIEGRRRRNEARGITWNSEQKSWVGPGGGEVVKGSEGEPQELGEGTGGPLDEGDKVTVKLDGVGVFEHRRHNTIYRYDTAQRGKGQEEEGGLARLREDLLRAVGHVHSAGEYKPHLTIAQSEDSHSSAHKFLVEKVGLLPTTEWEVKEVWVLVRDTEEGSPDKGRMNVWGRLNVAEGQVGCEIYGQPVSWETVLREEWMAGWKVGLRPEWEEEEEKLAVKFDEKGLVWVCDDGMELEEEEEDTTAPETLRILYEEGRTTPEIISISSWNVLADFEHSSSSTNQEARYRLILRNLLFSDAKADILLLQEVTDSFLSFLLSPLSTATPEHRALREYYPYASHPPPSQPDASPLPNFLNQMVLSKHPFDWSWLPFARKHKGSVIARFPTIHGGDQNKSLVLAAVHLSHGLTDMTVAAKKGEIQRVMGHLKEHYPDNPWVVAGDFNLTSSSWTIEHVVKAGKISRETVTTLNGIERLWKEEEGLGMEDAWVVGRAALGEGLLQEEEDMDEEEDNGLFAGEQGATYDPMRNDVAAKVVGSGGNMRPQRYDRILVRGQQVLRIGRFNRFGFVRADHEKEEGHEMGQYASDHWGVRCFLKVVQQDTAEQTEQTTEKSGALETSIKLTTPDGPLSETGSLNEAMTELDIFPSHEETAKRKAAFQALKAILLDQPSHASTTDPTTSEAPRSTQPPLIITPVGSFALGVYTPSSDIDVLAIGPFSSSTFFSLAIQRLRRASTSSLFSEYQLKILRRIHSSTGTMLELSLSSIKFDLQYCPAAHIASNWPSILSTAPPGNPVWSLPALTLTKLKAVRDLDYLRRTVPDLAVFRQAHRAIRTWAKSRGVYAQRFGYLGGIQISVMLARVHKALALTSSVNTIGAEELVATFFTDYASFDWEKGMVYDEVCPWFRQKKEKGGEKEVYRRTSREAMVVLGWFGPGLNTSGNASVWSARTLGEEFGRSRDALTKGEVEGWKGFLEGNGAGKFLEEYRSYVKVDVQYWGLSPSRGAQFVGWLESRLVMLLVDLHRRAPGVYVRMWPARFVEGDAASQQQGEDDEKNEAGPRDYQASYLLGLDADANTSKEDLKLALGSIQTALQRFEEAIRSDEKYFDASNSWMSASVVKRSELGNLVLDTNNDWVGEYTPGEDESDTDAEDDDEENLLEDLSLDEVTPRKKKGKNKKPTDEPRQTRQEPGPKLRSAADVMNRLRWDSAIDSSDYVVGYEDRFLGVKERALDMWKTEQTDEEFIPQHRIVFFKRRSDGQVVWDRKTKKDEVFGSGRL